MPLLLQTKLRVIMLLPNWEEVFLNALRHRPVVTYAANIAKRPTGDLYRRRKADPGFAQRWDEAVEEGLDRTEAEAFRRGTDGWHEPVVHQGRVSVLTEPVLDDEGNCTFDEKGNMRMRPVFDEQGRTVPLTLIKFSDTLLIKTLAARRANYRTERTEITNPDGSLNAADDVTRAARIAALVELAQRRKEEAEANPEPGADFA